MLKFRNKKTYFLISSHIRGRTNSGKTKGAALIIAVLLISVIGAIAFGASLLGLSEFLSGKTIEHSIEAFYAAEAGIEDGLARFQHYSEQNFEIPKNANKDSGLWAEVDLDEGLVSQTNYSDPVDSGKHIYKLKVWSKIKCDPNTLSPEDYEKYCTFELARDESVTLDISDVSSSFKIETEKANSLAPEPEKIALWFRYFGGEELDIPVAERISQDFYECISGWGGVQVTGLSNQVNVDECDFRLHNGRVKTYGANNLKIKTFARQVGPDSQEKIIKIKLITSGDDYIGGPFLNIESTGFYKGSKRRIVAEVNRQSKSILDIFDYTLYSNRDLD